MDYKRVLLINPPYSGARVKAVFCAGLGYIAEILEKHSIEYDVLDMSLGYSFWYLKRKIDIFQPDLLGISMMTYRYKETYALLEKIKQAYPGVDIVAGGPHVSLLRQKVLEDCSFITYGVVLEGEETIVELCQGKNPEDIKGLIFEKQGSIFYNGDREFLRDLDNIPFPRYAKFELEKTFNKNVNALPIVSSRGCPFECVYCPVKCSIGQTFRTRSSENIMEELDYWHRMGYRRFSFADDNFTLIRERVYSLCQEIRKSNLKELKLSCDNGIRADSVDKELLKFMREVGFFRIAIGVEAGNNKVLKNLKKKEDIETIKKTIAEACNLGYEVDLFFLVGSPGETWEDVRDSFGIALGYPISTAYFYNIIPFPNTELFSWIEKNGRFLKKPEEYLNEYPILDNVPVFETADMPQDKRKRLLKEAFGITRKTMRKSWMKRLAHFGILGKVAAFLYTTSLIQDVMLRKRFLRRIIYGLANTIFPE